jgi:hypothetical protein
MKKYSKPVVTANDVVSETLGQAAPHTSRAESFNTTKLMGIGFGL